MSVSTQQVLKYINLARQYPKYYLSLVDQHINSFIDDMNIKLTPDIIYETIEGKSVWEDARQFLIRQEPLRPFDLHQGLTKAASDHARDIVKNISNGHQGSDGSTFIDRIQRYCKKGKGSMIELIGAMHLIPGKNSIELALVNLIVDDGVANRGHRRALFSKDYKHIGVEFITCEDKIYSVVSMSQANLELLKFESQSIATSTSHLKTLTDLPGEMKQGCLAKLNGKENCIDEIQVKASRVNNSPTQNINNDQVWTLKNVTTDIKSSSKNRLDSRPNIQINQPQPSIFREVQTSPRSNHSIKNSNITNHFACRQNQASVLSKDSSSNPAKKQQVSHALIKESSLKNSQQSIKSDNKQKNFTNSLGFGTSISSQVQKLKVKSVISSLFYKSPSKGSGFESTPGGKKIVEQKQTIRTWNEDEFLVKQVIKIVKYEDGSVQDSVQKHSILKSQSILKQMKQ